jgi:hypothetical protein
MESLQVLEAIEQESMEYVNYIDLPYQISQLLSEFTESEEENMYEYVDYINLPYQISQLLCRE